MRRSMRMTLCLASIALIALVFATQTATMQDSSERGSLSTATNSLSTTYHDKTPSIQSGFKNPDDAWLLYAPEFDVLSSSSQLYLLRKYGLVDFSTPDNRASQINTAKAASKSRLAAALAEVAGDNVKVNNPATDLRQRVQSETSSATSGSNVVVVYNDISVPGYTSSISYSNDGGKTFKQRFPPLYPFGSGSGDPVVTAGPDGVFYHSILATNALGLSTIGVTRSDNGGATWSPLINATASTTSSTVFQDKEWIAADNTDSPYRGNVYVSWTRFGQVGGSGIAFVRSTDGGKTWSQFRLISPPTNFGGSTQGSTIGVGPEGEVYVAYYDSRIPGVAVVKSTNGGQTFGPPVVALRDQSLLSRNLAGGYDLPPFPSIGVDTSDGPHRGSIFIVNNPKPTTPRDDSDVVLVKSTDGGATWSAPVNVCDDETDTDQFQPSLAVAQDGTLGVMWYDRRNDPRNNVLVDVYATTSTDGGNTFTPNRRITTSNWLFPPTLFGLRPGYQGDYNQMSAGELGFVFNWADGRSGTDPDIYTAVLSTGEAQQQPVDLEITSETPALNGFTGSSAIFNILLPNEDAGTSVSVAPSYPGLQYDLVPAAQGVTLVVQIASGTKLGTYPITVLGKAGEVERATSLRLTVYDRDELRTLPKPISNIRDQNFRPRAVTDSQNNLHVVAGSDSRRFFSTFLALDYRQYQQGREVVATNITRLADPTAYIDNQTIGVDDAGNITVVWRQFTSFPTVPGPLPPDIGSNIFLSRSTDGGQTFSAPVNISATTGPITAGNALLPTLAVSKSGTINVAYLGSSGFSADIVFTRSTDGGATFSARQSVTGGSIFSVNSPVIAVDSEENVAIAYFGSNNSTRGDIFLSQTVEGTRFLFPVNVSRAGTSGGPVPPFQLGANVFSPGIAIDTANNINIVYGKSDASLNEQDIYYTRSTDKGTTFSTPINVSKVQGLETPSFSPYVGIDAAGNIGVSWTARTEGLLFPGGSDVLFAASSDAGQTFTPARNVSNNIGQQIAFTINSTIITDENGELAVFWEDDTGGNNQIYVVTP